MTTPVYDFAARYAAGDTARLHMPGHKGKPFLGCEPWDLTEIRGADELYAPAGILAESEKNAAALFGSAATLYSTEGSSQCVRALVYLALLNRPGAPILAARNVHKSFVYAAGLCGAEVVWLWPERRDSLCSCEITPGALERALSALPAPPAAVYVTSPDYLGNTADLAALAAVCRRYDAPLLVDNAHGAYLRFLRPSRHPLDMGAALCCDSAHKTLPALTGGAYLHVGKTAPAGFAERARAALALFGSTSPSYLILASMDRCNAFLAGDYSERLAETAARLQKLRTALRARGWTVQESDPLRLTLRGDGAGIAARLRRGGVEPEYADRDFCVLMASPENAPRDLERVFAALGDAPGPAAPPPELPLGRCERACSIRAALFAPWEAVPAARAAGRVCAAPAVSCPPAVPVAVSGERVSAEAAALFQYYGIERVPVLLENI